MATNSGPWAWIAKRVMIIAMFLASSFILARIQEKVSFHVWEFSSQETVNLRTLNVRSLKQVLDSRGIDYRHAIEKSEFRDLVKDSGVLREGELFLARADGADSELPTKYFTAPELFSKEVLAPSHAWLVQVGVNEEWPTVTEDDWSILVQKLGRLGMRTARFYCRRQHYQTNMLCDNKGWFSPQLVLVFPTDNVARNYDNAVVASYKGTQTAGAIFSWIRSALEIVIRDINIEHASHLRQFELYWLQEEPKTPSETIRIVYVADKYSNAPALLPFLGVKFRGRVKIGVARGAVGERMLDKFGIFDSRPVCLIMTPEGVWSYGKRPGEYFSFEALDMYINSLVLEGGQIVFKAAIALSILMGLVEFCIERGDVDGFSLLRPFLAMGAMLVPFWIWPSIRQMFLYIRPDMLLRRLASSGLASLAREDILLGRYWYNLSILGTLIISFGLWCYIQKVGMSNIIELMRWVSYHVIVASIWFMRWVSYHVIVASIWFKRWVSYHIETMFNAASERKKAPEHRNEHRAIEQAGSQEYDGSSSSRNNEPAVLTPPDPDSDSEPEGQDSDSSRQTFFFFFPVVKFDGELREFLHFSTDDVKNIVLETAKKSCVLDTLPPTLLRENIDQLAPFFRKLFETSFETGLVPDGFKHAVVQPLIKKPSADQEVLSNYRPVSNLPILFKALEKLATKTLDSHLSQYDLYAKCQSAYREQYSTETALLKVHSDIISALDRGESAVLVLLDLSAAFDIIDHDLLIDRLEQRFGVSGVVLDWFRSYLSGRTQCVVVNGVQSESRPLKCGVPQGSRLGPVLFTLYTSPLEDIFRKHGLAFMLYADDTQIYIIAKSPAEVLERLERCIEDVRNWMRDNLLMLNDSKTECIVFSSKNRNPLSETVKIGDSFVNSIFSVRNLGVVFDHHLTMSEHVKNVCKAASFGVYKIGKIRRYLDVSATEKLVHAFVTSKMDYCNSLLLGIHDNELKKLQLLHNAAARIVSRRSKFDHITPILFDLHWLPVTKRIDFKVLLMTYKILHGLAPSYMDDLVRRYNPPRSLRSDSKMLLDESYARKNNEGTSYYGGRNFVVQAPILYNQLPESMRKVDNVDIFKKRLKTYLFEKYFKS